MLSAFCYHLKHQHHVYLEKGFCNPRGFLCRQSNSFYPLGTVIAQSEDIASSFLTQMEVKWDRQSLCWQGTMENVDRNGRQLWSYGVKLAIIPLALVTCGGLIIKTINYMDYIANIHSYIYTTFMQHLTLLRLYTQHLCSILHYFCLPFTFTHK